MSDYKYILDDVHVSTIARGDTVMHNGYMVTVGGRDLRNGFHGPTLFGDSYRSGTIPVKKVIFYKPFNPLKP